MNCSECQENLIAYIECLLDPEATAACRSHLETCALCREEEHAVTGLHERLQDRGQAGSERLTSILHSTRWQSIQWW